MFHLLYKEYFNRRRHGGSSRHIFIISVAVFICLNLVENVIHYSIGRTHGASNVSFMAPSSVDWVRIIVIMVIFALLQGLFTMALSSNYEFE